MPFSANAWSRIDTPRRARPARALGEWDHDSEGDVFVPPPPDALPASLRPSRSNDAWLLHAPGASSAAGPGLVRRGRHAPARDGSESPDVHRLRVRLAQLEPVLDDARRDARLAARAQRTAAAERDRTRATLAATRRDASETIERARREREAARAATETARRATRALLVERDALVQNLAALAEAAARSERDARAATRETAPETARRAVSETARRRKRSAMKPLGEEQKPPRTRDAETSARAPEEAFADLLAATEEAARRAGFRDGEARGRDATSEAFAEERRLAEAARDAARARATAAEARVVRLAARLDVAREAAAAERRSAVAAAKTRDEKDAAARAEASVAAEALAAAETREGVFRERLEAMALALAARDREEARVPSRAAPRRAARERGRTPPRATTMTVSGSSPTREDGVLARDPRAETFLKLEPGGDEKGGDARAPRVLRGEGELPDWLPEVRPPPRVPA